VRRTLAERVLVGGLRNRIVCTENVRYVLKQVEQEVAKLCADVPETVRLKQAELQAEERKISNFVGTTIRPTEARGRMSEPVQIPLETGGSTAMNVARRLQYISVLAPDGCDVRLGDLWREQTVVLAFIRHFG
jgi:hypothetical protein